MKWLLTILALLGIAYGQTTNVSFTITDSDSQTWNNGSFIVTFVPTPGNPGPYLYQGVPMTQAQKGPYSGVMNGSGTGTITLPSNNFITPSGTKWQFVIAPNASAPSSTMTATITGASQNLSASFSSQVRAPRFPALGTSSWGYLDGEVTPIPNPGGAYFNVTSKVVRIWDGTQWINGSGISNGLIISPAGIPAPSPLASVACPVGQNPFEYILKADSTYQDVASLDATTVSPPTSPAGTINNCWRTWWNDAGVAMPGGKNRFVSIYHVPGLGGINSNAGAFDESAFSAQMSNTGSEQTFRQLLTQYNELQLVGAPTFVGTAGSEDNAASLRINLTDNRTGGTSINKITAIDGVAFQNSTTAPVYASCGNGGCFTGVTGQVDALVAAAFTGSPIFEAFLAKGNNSGASTGAGFIGFHAKAPTTRFSTFNAGVDSDNYGTNANDYDFVGSGVNSSGTPAGFNAFVGPTFFGNQAHVTAGYQIESLGAFKIKAAAGVRQIDLFGSTSGSCGLSTDATSTSLTSGCRLLVPNGSLAAPAYSFTSETGMGMYRGGNNILNFAVNGFDVFTVNDGNVGISGNRGSICFSSGDNSSTDCPIDIQRLDLSGNHMIIINNNTGELGAWDIKNLSMRSTLGANANIDFPVATDYLISGIETTTPTNPAATFEKTYFKAGKGLCALDSSGTERCTQAAGSTVLHARTTSTCTTGNSSFDTCDTTLTWSSSFGDTSYTATCSGVGPVDGGNPTTGRVNLQIASRTATQVVARTVTLGATAVSWTEIDCIGIHD